VGKGHLLAENLLLFEMGWQLLVVVATAALAKDNATTTRRMRGDVLAAAKRCVASQKCAWVKEDASCAEACRRTCVCPTPEQPPQQRRFFGSYGRSALLCAWLLARLASFFFLGGGGGDRDDALSSSNSPPTDALAATTPLMTTTTPASETEDSTTQHTGPLLPLELFLLFSVGRTVWADERSQKGTLRAAAVACVRWAADASSAAALVSLGLSRGGGGQHTAAAAPLASSRAKRSGLSPVARWCLVATCVCVLGELFFAMDVDGGKLDFVLDPFLNLGVLVAMSCGPYDTWAARWLSYWSLAAGLAPSLVDAAVSDFAGADVWHRPGIHGLRASAEVLACWATGQALRNKGSTSSSSGEEQDSTTFAFVVAGWSWLAVHFGLSVAAIVDPRRFRVALGVAVVALHYAFGKLTTTEAQEDDHHSPGTSVPLYAALFVLASDHTAYGGVPSSGVKRSASALETSSRVLRRLALVLLESAAVVAALSLAFSSSSSSRTPFFLRLQPDCVLLAIVLRRLDDASSAWHHLGSCRWRELRCRRSGVAHPSNDPHNRRSVQRHHQHHHRRSQKGPPSTPAAAALEDGDAGAPLPAANSGDHDDRKRLVPADPRAARVRADATRNHLLVLFLAMWILVILRLMHAIFPFSHPASHAC